MGGWGLEDLEKCSYNQRPSEGPITWSFFNPEVELSPGLKTKTLLNQITWQNFQPRAEFNPGNKTSAWQVQTVLKFQSQD